MGIDIASFRARIGTFNRFKVLKPLKKSVLNFSFFLYCSSLAFILPWNIVLSIIGCFLISFLLFIVFSIFVTLFLMNFLYSAFFVSVAGASASLKKCCKCLRFRKVSGNSFAYTTIVMILLVSFGHVETNPGPISSATNKLTFGVWNFDSLLARDGIKKTFIEGIDACHQFDIFGVCESFLTDKVCDKDLDINGFCAIPLRADCTDITNSAHGGVCLYFKEHLPNKERIDLTSLDETIVAEIVLKSKKVFFVLSYRSPSKSSKAEILDYISKLNNTMANINKEKPSLVVLTGDFNARSQLFWAEEHINNDAGNRLSEFMLLNGLE